MEPWHDRGVAHSTSRCASLQRTREVGGTLCFGKNFCHWLQQQRVESPHIVVSCGLSRSRFPIAHDSTHVMCITVDVTQCCSRSTKTNYGGADGWQPKSPPTASGRGNQPAGSLSQNETAHFEVITGRNNRYCRLTARPKRRVSESLRSKIALLLLGLERYQNMTFFAF